MTSSGAAKPELALNRHGTTVADSLNGFIEFAGDGLVNDVRLDIATAYFNVGGYSLLADSLDKISNVRLLLGAEPAPPERRSRALQHESVNERRVHQRRVDDLLGSHEKAMADDRDLLGFTHEADASARRLVAWLRSPTVEVRRLQDRFLHGKAFLVATNAHGVVSGSSNFTRAGLSTNLELNLGNYTAHTVDAVSEWFDELWDAASDYDLAALFESRFEPHSPQLIYLRMLWERYAAELAAEDEGTMPRSTIELTSFQKDGLWRARKLLEEYNGVLIADEVGLGKTYFAGKLIEEAGIERRQSVLVVCPATLRDGPWKAFEKQHNLPMTLVSFEELAADPRLNPDLKQQAEEKGQRLANALGDIDRYALVVIDEAHNLRNPSTQRADALRRLLAGLPPKKLVLMTATPVNNSLWDLHSLLSYFLRNDGVFAANGIRSLRDHFAAAMTEDPNDLSPQHLFDVLDAVAVRRTRSFIKKHYSGESVGVDGRQQQIVFPTPRLHKVTYDMDSVLPGFFEKLEAAIDPDADPAKNDQALTLARYVPSNYEHGRDNPELYELRLAGLLRSALLKRFESSPRAFARTCERMAESCKAFAHLAEHEGKLASGGAVADWANTDSDDLDAVDLYLDTHVENLEDVAPYDVERMVADARRDERILRRFARTANTVTRDKDPTLEALAKELAEIAAQARREGVGTKNERDRRKVLVFTYFADTVDWIFEFLQEATTRNERLAAYRGRIARHSGGSGGGQSPDAMLSFAPDTAAPRLRFEDRYDILVTTDVLAEGVNLQQARHIINYDLPWNPMRLVQRHGRIDRIGSPHSEVFIRSVFPDSRLDALLGLEERLNRKIAQAAVSVGVGDVIPGQQRRLEQNFAETREEIQRLRADDAALFERCGTELGAQSGEEFRAELRLALENPVTAADLRRLPWGTGSGMAARAREEPGHVFCARVGDDPNPQFRFVATSGEVYDDTLRCLWLARPSDGFDTPRVLDDATASAAFDAWATAQDHIVDRWNFFADKANLEAKIPRALREAADIVRAHPPADRPDDDINQAVEALQAPLHRAHHASHPHGAAQPLHAC